MARLNLITELATVSVIHMQKKDKKQNKHTKVMTRNLLASFLWTRCTVRSDRRLLGYFGHRPVHSASNFVLHVPDDICMHMGITFSC